ncbi:hypothetical protein EV188_106233 [Actinomycetospora succinea]|uniref:Replication-associated protein ORF2/G2P domain-containing protein n=1 Tax=Actinomycetospora succinea TaxID=663603 RepID=A0A4R6VBM4_9PSEU|nr:hypothetical protein [Actinomycetospora succinea]TDQ54086.1 hypothetical protein EV188_106233 [Actinomycetospora succinea]
MPDSPNPFRRSVDRGPSSLSARSSPGFASWCATRRTDPWRTYTPPAAASPSLAAVGGEAGPPARVEDRSGRRKPAAPDPAAPVAEGGRHGLVLCAISGRGTPNTTDTDPADAEPETVQTPAVPDSAAGLWEPAFPSPELVHAAAALLPAITEAPGTLAEGPRWELTVGPGMFAVACHDWSKRERTAERQRQAHAKDVDQAVAQHIATGEWPAPPTPRQPITGWSRKSRNGMVRRLCELDYTPLFAAGRLPAMVTLTYPGDWLTVVPTGDVLKRHMKALRKRYARAWGEDWAAVWKLEFQRRGAPHVHMLCTPPHGRAKTTGQTFATWLSAAWADVVDHPDPEQRRRHELAGTALDYREGLRAKDPKRVAAYFTKHGLLAAKEYQHDVPSEWQAPGTGPGRFWGVWALKRATRTVAVTPEVGVQAGRIARRWARAQRRTKIVTRPRVEQPTGRIRYRRTRTRVQLMTNGNCGWVGVNNGPAFSSALAGAVRHSHEK